MSHVTANVTLWGKILNQNKVPSFLSSLRSRCGRHNVHGIGVRITLSENATTQFGEWPHMCAVLEKRDGVNHFVCGASLIDDGIIMTSAHYMQ